MVLMAGVIFTELEVSVDVDADADADAVAEFEGVLSENGCQEPPHTWRTSSILLMFLMVIIMIGAIFSELDCA